MYVYMYVFLMLKMESNVTHYMYVYVYVFLMLKMETESYSGLCVYIMYRLCVFLFIYMYIYVLCIYTYMCHFLVHKYASFILLTCMRRCRKCVVSFSCVSMWFVINVYKCRLNAYVRVHISFRWL